MLLLLGAVFFVVVSGMPILGHELGLRPAQTVGPPMDHGTTALGRPGALMDDPRFERGIHQDVLGFGRVRQDTPLSSWPEEGARPRGRLIAGEHVLVMRELGGWVEVVRRPHEKDENVGWVPVAAIDVL